MSSNRFLVNALDQRIIKQSSEDCRRLLQQVGWIFCYSETIRNCTRPKKLSMSVMFAGIFVNFKFYMHKIWYSSHTIHRRLLLSIPPALNLQQTIINKHHRHPQWCQRRERQWISTARVSPRRIQQTLRVPPSSIHRHQSR